MTDKVADDQVIGTTRQYGGPMGSEDVEALDIPSLGRGIELASDRKVDFTVRFATKLLEMKRVPGERNLRDDHVDYLINCMVRGTFRPEITRVASCVCLELSKDDNYRINAQHTAWARVLAGAKINDFKVQYLQYIAKTDQDMRAIYAAYDRNAPRTKANVIAVHLTGIGPFAGFTNRIIHFLQVGLGVWLWETDYERNKRDGDDLAYLMQTEYVTITGVVGSYLSSIQNLSRHTFITRSSVIGAMFATFTKSVPKATEFWNSVITGVGMADIHDPRLMLRNELQASRITNSAGTKGVKKVDREKQYRQCLHAWNAFRDNRTLESLITPMASARPKVK